jgi:hypothetical protein|uniref:Uncharacterized protein n=1 Tax=Siphoviridae sp. ctoyo6 TaxID=2825674 RepID=A0A8S5U355_9CAUD|nr:MAG TPA: hypothetical protein [Siphoviridae sp. ctoyo6]
MLYTQGIYIDGMYFDVPLVSVKREAKVLDKFAEREEESGDMLRELLGVYLNYTMNFGTIDDDDLYERLFDKLTEPVAFHDVTLPSTKKSYTFKCYVSSVSDEMEKILDDTVKFKGLTCKYIAKAPWRTP